MIEYTQEQKQSILKQLKEFNNSEAKRYLEDIFRVHLKSKADKLRILLRLVNEDPRAVYTQGAAIDGYEEGFQLLSAVIEALEEKKKELPKETPIY